MTSFNLVVILLCVAGISAGQILFKLASRTLRDGQPLIHALVSPYFLFGILIYGIATLAWIWQLSKVDLNRAYPLMTLSFIFVPLMSVYVLAESVSPRYWVGLALVLLGLYVILSGQTTGTKL